MSGCTVLTIEIHGARFKSNGDFDKSNVGKVSWKIRARGHRGVRPDLPGSESALVKQSEQMAEDFLIEMNHMGRSRLATMFAVALRDYEKNDKKR